MKHGVCYSVEMGGRNLSVLVDYRLFQCAPEFFSNLFPGCLAETCTLQNAPGEETLAVKNKEEFDVYIHEKTADCQTLQRAVITCDPGKSDWPIVLMTDLEETLIHLLQKTVFHGAALVNEGKTLLLLGARKSGKSTLTHFLTLQGWSLVDDDCVFFDGNHVFGTGFPLRLRRQIYPDPQVFWKCQDSEGETRRLLKPGHVCRCADAPFFLLFPRYDPQIAISVERLERSSLFPQMIQNIRYAANGPRKIQDALNLIRCVQMAYNVIYSDENALLSLIKERIMV